MSQPLTKYTVNAIDLFSGINGPGQPIGAIEYNVNGTNLFTYYTSQTSNYQSNLSKFNYTYNGTPFDIMLYNYFSKAIIGTPANATFSNLFGRLCWKITGTTTFTVNFPNATTINLVAVGGGQKGFSVSGGYGGGVVRGKLTTVYVTSNTLTITIGGSAINTTITSSSPSISVTANAGSSTGTGGTTSGITSPVISLGGQGGLNYSSSGSNGPFITDLGIYVAGGGGAVDSSGSSSPPGGLGGGGTGGNIGGTGGPGQANTGGGGGGGGAGGNGGSGVVYLYI